MDDVICSHILLSCKYDTFITLAKVNKKFYKVSKIVWNQWLKLNLKKDYYDKNVSYTYYNGKNGKRIFHGVFNVNPYDSKIHKNYYSLPPDPFNCREYTLNYKHGKLDGKCCFYKKPCSFVIAEYKKGCLHG